MALLMFGGAPLPLPGPHHVSEHAVVLQTAPPGPFLGAPPSVPHHRTGDELTPPPLSGKYDSVTKEDTIQLKL